MYKIPERTATKRLEDWYKFRKELEASDTPFEDTHRYFNKLPKVKIYTDPYDQSTWPTAWQLIEENEYCPFNQILGVCYTLQMLNRFSKINPLITISLDKINKTVYYLLFIDDKVYGYDSSGWIPAKSMPKTLVHTKIYSMPPIH